MARALAREVAGCGGVVQAELEFPVDSRLSRDQLNNDCNCNRVGQSPWLETYHPTYRGTMRDIPRDQ